MNTKQTTTDGGELAQTTFCFDPSKPEGLASPDLISDLGVYGPSGGDDLFVPFYPDASQRVLVVAVMGFPGFLVIKTEALLRLARERKGKDLQWGEWQAYTTRVSRDHEAISLWVSGPLVFCVAPARRVQISIEVYDFSVRASARHVKMVEDGMAERFEPWITHVMPWWLTYDIISYGCYNSTTFIWVKFHLLSNQPKTNVYDVRILTIRQHAECLCGTLYDLCMTSVIQRRVPTLWR